MVETRSKSLTKILSKCGKRIPYEGMAKTRSKSWTKVGANKQIKQKSNKKDLPKIIRQTSRGSKIVQTSVRSVVQTRRCLRSSVRFLNKKIKKIRKTIVDKKNISAQMHTKKRSREVNKTSKNDDATNRREDSVIFLGIMKIRKPKTVKCKQHAHITRGNKVNKTKTGQEPLPSIFTKVKTEFPNFKKFVRYINKKMPKRRPSQISIITVHSDSSEVRRNLEETMLFPELDPADQKYLDEVLKMINAEDLQKLNEYIANMPQEDNVSMNINSDDGGAGCSQQDLNYHNNLLPSD